MCLFVCVLQNTWGVCWRGVGIDYIVFAFLEGDIDMVFCYEFRDLCLDYCRHWHCLDEKVQIR